MQSIYITHSTQNAHLLFGVTVLKIATQCIACFDSVFEKTMDSSVFGIRSNTGDAEHTCFGRRLDNQHSLNTMRGRLLLNPKMPPKLAIPRTISCNSGNCSIYEHNSTFYSFFKSLDTIFSTYRNDSSSIRSCT